MEPDHLGRPRLGDSGRSHAAMVLTRRIEAMSPRHREMASAPAPTGGRDNITERRADVAPMRAKAGLATTAAASVRPKIASLKFLCRSADRPLFFHCDGTKKFGCRSIYE